MALPGDESAAPISELIQAGTSGQLMPELRTSRMLREQLFKAGLCSAEVEGRISETVLNRIPLCFDKTAGNKIVNDFTAFVVFLKSAEFAALEDSQMIEIVTAIGLLPCIKSCWLEVRRDYYCPVCDSPKRKRNSPRRDQWPGLFHVIGSLAGLELVSRSERLGPAVLLSLRRILCHFEPSPTQGDVVRKWCHTMLQSRNSRESRVAASRVLALLVLDTDSDATLEDQTTSKYLVFNTVVQLHEMSMTEKYLSEAAVMAWSDMAKISEGDELIFMLIKLLVYLDSDNSFDVSLAFHELRSLAALKGLSTWQFMAPFWSTVSVYIVKHFSPNSTFMQIFADLLDVSVDTFLTRTQEYTIPYLVQWRRKAVVRYIADIECKSIFDICTQHMYAILGVLLTRDVKDPVREAISSLAEMSDNFARLSVVNLIRSDLIIVSIEVLKVYSIADIDKPDNEVTVFKAINLIADLDFKTDSSKSQRPLSHLDNFFSKNILGVFSRFSDMLYSVHKKLHWMEKLQCLRGIAATIRFAKERAVVAIPQICSCLQASLEDPLLQEAALLAWMNMIIYFGSNDVRKILQLTVSVTFYYWNTFSRKTKTVARKMLERVVQTEALQLARVTEIPSRSESIPEIKKIVSDMRQKLRPVHSDLSQLLDLTERCRHENFAVVHEALVELRSFLIQKQFSLYSMSLLSSPDANISDTFRTLLNVCRRYADAKIEIAKLAAECIGRLGSPDTDKLNDHSNSQGIVVVYNFEEDAENIDFVLTFLDRCLVPAFRSSADTKAQLFLAYAMQQLLKFCGLNLATVTPAGGENQYMKWIGLSQASKVTLTPFMTSRYDLNSNLTGLQQYPIFKRTRDHKSWLQTFTLDLLCRASLMLQSSLENLTSAESVSQEVDIFYIFSKIINNQDLSIAIFLLPFMVQHVISKGTSGERDNILGEILAVLNTGAEPEESRREDLRLSYQTVFSILDYNSRWQRARRKKNAELLQVSRRNGRAIDQGDNAEEDLSTETMYPDRLMKSIPGEVVAERAFESQSYARSLFYYEQYLREIKAARSNDNDKVDGIYRKLQQIYAKLDDPDAIQGISTLLLSTDLEQQILEHEAAGRWDLARNCYDIYVRDHPDCMEMQSKLLMCLRELNEYDAILNRLHTMQEEDRDQVKQFIDLAIEASWILNNWRSVEYWIQKATKPTFHYSVGKALTCIRSGNIVGLYQTLSEARSNVASEIAMFETSSPKLSHEFIFQLDILADIETMVMSCLKPKTNYGTLLHYMNQRTQMDGVSYRENRYLMDLRRVVIGLMRTPFSREDDLAVLLQKAKLARKAGIYNQAYSFVLCASKHDSPSVVIEQSRIQWDEGLRRQALKKLETIVMPPAVMPSTSIQDLDALPNIPDDQQKSITRAKAVLLYAKWFDQANQGSWAKVSRRYEAVIGTCESFESGYYYLGRYYVKILDSQKGLLAQQQNRSYITGEYHMKICESYCNALRNGVKHVYQILPKLVTIWLDFATEEYRHAGPASEAKDAGSARNRNLDQMTALIQDTFNAVPKYIFFTALAQMISRLDIDVKIAKVLMGALVSVALEYPEHALWQVLAISKSKAKERATKGKEIARMLTWQAQKRSGHLFRDIKNANHFMECLTHFCGVGFASDRQLDMNTMPELIKGLPCILVVPVRSNLTIRWPNKWGSSEDHMAFTRKVTIYALSPKVQVMTSLQKPKKICIIGSDGNDYPILCKPNDDLRKDARMMDLNGMINLLLETDRESSKRNLSITTYSVTVLNEEAGLIEWVSDTKTYRDILRVGYAARNIVYSFGEIKKQWDKGQDRLKYFERKLLEKFPPVLYEWFIEMFPTPTSWLEARTAYARTAAVMSVVGYVLGLGDRHCENILLHEGTGRLVHVDFSCLFEKGLDLAVPERVPFRLTHNIVNALGPYGYDGPFRRCCEIALRILRDNEEFLLPVLETFLHDPLFEWRTPSRRTNGNKGSATSPQDALYRIDCRLRGVVADESFPLSVEAHVDGLLHEATDNRRLSEMYIGWSPFW
ncbi:hypothetical protein V1525DRAFT_445429 [Lipomyces kononenkoae]|uniref:Uncharacterized protein n=1 Tax=Lipomyces kononenkoae TaxID=34357 RepID=A0ACC3SVZ8_LIPKO